MSFCMEAATSSSWSACFSSKLTLSLIVYSLLLSPILQFLMYNYHIHYELNTSLKNLHHVGYFSLRVVLIFCKTGINVF